MPRAVEITFVGRDSHERRRDSGPHRAHPSGHAMRRDRGFVLLAVLLVLTLLAVIVTELRLLRPPRGVDGPLLPRRRAGRATWPRRRSSRPSARS